MNLNWIKCNGDQWCNLILLNLKNSHFTGLTGVYIIWHGGQQPATVYVGKGNIADRLDDHRQDARILQYSHYGLFVTWARVEPFSQDSVERFLAEHLKPKVGQHDRYVPSIAVNLPW